MVGINIKQIRKEKGLKQIQLAQAVGLRQESLSRIERGCFDPSMKTLRNIAEKLNVPVSTLLEEKSA
jgi:transcriptional regulator with XRE-family HTH domain